MHHIIIDANIALHFKRIEQIDWLTCLEADEVKLVIVPQLMTELERKKVHGSSPSIRKRAAKFIDYLVEKMDECDPITIRPSVYLHFHTVEPTLDFERENLARDIDDDRYIASAIEIANHCDETVWIASQDGGMALKLRSRSIKLLRLSADDALPEEVDEETKQLRKAKQELERIKLARPHLTIGFANDAKIWEEEIPENIESSVDSLQEIAVQYAEPLRPNYRKPSNPSLSSFAQSAHKNALGQWEDDVRAREAFLRRYEQYLEAEAAWLDKFSRLIEVQLSIRNEGGASATHVGVSLAFPSGSTALEWTDFDERPSPPKRPSSHSFLDSFNSHLVRPDLGLIRDISMPSDGDVYIEDGGNEASFEVKVMKPKTTVLLEKFCIYLEPQLVGQTFTLDATISFVEGEPLSAQLPIRTHLLSAEGD